MKTEILATEEGPAAELINPGGQGDVVLVCEHASAFIPARLNGLGLSDIGKTAHIAWDPGALDVAMILSNLLDAPLVASRVSRLVYDCNRPPQSDEAIREQSELFDVPGNRNLSDADRKARVREVYDPFRTLLARVLADRAAQKPVLVTIHSFTPTYFGTPRTVELGLLHDRDDRLARAMYDVAAEFSGLKVCLNEPYGPQDGVTHTLVEHALGAGLLNVMVEIRNDLVTTEQETETVTGVLFNMLSSALTRCRTDSKPLGGGGMQSC